jgi:hypothetical protein
MLNPSMKEKLPREEGDAVVAALIEATLGCLILK